jgi:hypothetical protein
MFALLHSLEIFDCWGALCSRKVDASGWVRQIPDVTLFVALNVNSRYFVIIAL